jgi:hypothetical protein
MLHSGARRSIQTIQDYWFPNLPHVPWPLEPITLVGILAREEVVFNLGAGVPIVLQSSRRGLHREGQTLLSRLFARARSSPFQLFIRRNRLGWSKHTAGTLYPCQGTEHSANFSVRVVARSSRVAVLGNGLPAPVRIGF